MSSSVEEEEKTEEKLFLISAISEPEGSFTGDSCEIHFINRILLYFVLNYHILINTYEMLNMKYSCNNKCFKLNISLY